jgi:hypothetical protein
MPSLRELLAAKASGPPVPTLPVPQPAPDRQLGTNRPGEHDDVLPMAWPDPACVDGNKLAVMIDEKSQGWLGVMLPDGRFLYLLGPLASLSIPF